MPKHIITRVSWFALIIMSLTGVIAVIGHYGPQPSPADVANIKFGPGPEWFFEQMPRYRQHEIMTFLHLGPGLMFVLLAPLQLVKGFRNRYPVLHRANGYFLASVVAVISVSSVVIGFVMPFDGALQTYGSLFIATIFVVAMGIGIMYARQKDFAAHRRWMLRMVAIGFTPMTMRFVLAIGTTAFGFDFRDTFAESMLTGLAINLLVMETWLRRVKIIPPGQYKTDLLPVMERGHTT